MEVRYGTPRDRGALRGEELGRLLGQWQRRELLRARRFRECAGLSSEDLEDLYQDSALALLDREFENETHLCNALHQAIKHRALNAHRNRSRRARIIDRAQAGQDALTQATEREDTPEALVLAHHDQLIVGEFLTELTPLEAHVFRLLADGLAWRAAADALGCDRNEVRAAARACERKRERFALLYTTGRLCGYRAHTIQALNDGGTDSAQLARRAHAHLQSCARCRFEHGTDGERFRRIFERDALALVPLPALAQKLPLFARIATRANRATHHLTGTRTTGAASSLRAQLTDLLTSGGATAKVAVGAASLAVAAGGGIGASQILERHPPRHTATPTVRRAQRRVPADLAYTALGRARYAAWPAADAATTDTRNKTARRQTRRAAARNLDIPPGAAVTAGDANGFAYLGVPHPAPTSGTPARVARAPSAAGGAFSP